MLFAPIAFAAVHVVVWHSYRAGEQKGLEQAAQTYQAAHPDVTIETVAIPFDAYSYKLEAAIPRGNGPDLFIGKDDNVGEWARAGLIEPLPNDDALRADLDALLPGLIDPVRVNKAVYGLPITFKSIAMFYRTDILPAAPRTTDELTGMVKHLGPGNYAFAYEAGNFFYQVPWLHAFGGRILDDDGQPRLDSEAAIKSYELIRRWNDAHLMPEETSSTVATQLFNSGKAPITFNGPWFLGEIEAGVPFAVAPLPIVSATGRRAAPLVDVEAAMIAARAKEPSAALAFARWLAGPEGALIRARVGRQTVSAPAAWDDPAIKADPILQAFRAQLADCVPASNRPEMHAVWEPANRALRRVLRGAADPRAALAEAQQLIKEELRPAPPEAARGPYAIAASLIALIGCAWMIRRARANQELASVKRQRWAYAYLAPAALAMLVLVFVPFAVGAGMSLFHHDAGRWTFIGARNFVDILASREGPAFAPLSFYFTLIVTALWTLVNVALHVTIGVTLALLLRDPLLKLRGVYRVLLIVPWAMPNYITALIWKGMFHRQFGAINGLLAAIGLEPVSWFSRFWTSFTANVATNVWLGFPFMMVVTLGALSRIPRELEEAAALDGASRWQRLRHVVLPLLRPAIWPSVILGAVWTFNMFNIVFLVSGGEPDGATEILVSQAYRWAFTRGHRYGYAAAYAVLIFVVLALQTALTRRAQPEAQA